MDNKQISSRNITIAWLFAKKLNYDLSLDDVHRGIKCKLFTVKNRSRIKLYERSSV